MIDADLKTDIYIKKLFTTEHTEVAEKNEFVQENVLAINYCFNNAFIQLPLLCDNFTL